MKTLNLIEDSYTFETVKTELNISPDFIQMKLAQLVEYRNEYNDSVGTLWATIHENGKEIERFIFDYNSGLTKK